MKISIKDNSSQYAPSDPQAIEDLKRIAGISLDKLQDEDGNDLWLFPPKKSRYDDKIQDEYIFTLEGDLIKTGNIMGFIGSKNTELTINSRFSNDDGNDWFMQYMLQKIFAINIFDLKHSRSIDSILDIAALMFPYFLQKALHQGLYREYIHQDYNDNRVRGALDISRHIKENYPFKNGKMAYTTREFKYDNSITQLIRHTIEFIKTKKRSLSFILYSSPETQANIKQIINATPSYRKGDLNKVLLSNIKPKFHPYYSEYQPLQRLCLKILRSERISLGDSSEQIQGILFDGAWLWEEYLNLTFSKAGFLHPENRTGKGKIYPFIDRNRYARYPDFIKKNIIADAKYKFLLQKNGELVDDRISKDDLNQMIAYMHITSSHDGIYVNPLNFRVLDNTTGHFYPETAFCLKVGELYGNGGTIHVIGINIPQKCNSYKEFVSLMEKSEDELLKKLIQFN